MNKTVLVTGGAGFIGQHVVRALLAQGHRVRVLDDLSMGRQENVPAGAELVVGDVRDRAKLTLSMQDVNAVVHLAARVSVRRSVDQFADDASVNVMGTLCVLEALRTARVEKFVLASSMAVYADSASGARLREDSRTEPTSPYGAGKLAAEMYTKLVCAQHNVDAAVLRLFNTYGPGQALTPYVGVATLFLNALRKGEPLHVFGDGLQQRDFVHVSDVAQAVCLTLSTQTRGQVFNVGTGHATTVLDLAHALRSAVGGDSVILHAAPQPGELRCAVADVERIEKVLGWKARVDTFSVQAMLDAQGMSFKSST